MDTLYDLLVIGAGPGGYPAAVEAAKLGKKAAVIEKAAVGGTCLNCGCIPMKTLLHTSGLYRSASLSLSAGLEVQGLRIDAAALHEHKNRVIQTLAAGILQQFSRYGVTLYNGTALVTAPGQVTVFTAEDGSPKMLTAANILIAAGSEPSDIPVPGLKQPGIDSSTTLLDRIGLYGSLIIIGGGVIGMEFASFYTDLGIPVTVIEALDHILPAMDRETAQNLKMILTKRGADIHAGAKVVRVYKTDSGTFCCVYEENGIEKTASAEGLLVATGRHACGDRICTPEISEKLGIVKGRIPVHTDGRTEIPGIYAAGDVTGGIQLAHAATAAGLNAVAAMFGGSTVKDTSHIPSCVYTDPEIAAVGMTAEEAAKNGIEVKTGKYIMSVNGKSVLSMQERGFIKITAETASGRVIGAQLMCARATDMAGMLEIAISQGVTAAQLASLIMPHPTFSEGISEAAAGLIS